MRSKEEKDDPSCVLKRDDDGEWEREVPRRTLSLPLKIKTRGSMRKDLEIINQKVLFFFFLIFNFTFWQ